LLENTVTIDSTADGIVIMPSSSWCEEDDSMGAVASHGDENHSTTSTEHYVQQHGVDNDNNALWLHSLKGGKLFERETHRSMLMDAYRRCVLVDSADKNRPMEIVLITGPSGTGKSYLARSICEEAQERDDAYVLYGKASFQQSVPLAPFVDAFSDFVQEVLRRGKDDPLMIQQVQTAIEESTKATDVSFLLDMIPAFANLVKNSCEFKDNGGETQRRTSLSRPNAETPGIAIICKFLQIICSQEDFRMILFVDDLQWLDPASIQMFRRIASTRLDRLLLLGTCRGDEMTTQDELSVVLRAIEDNGVRIDDVQVENLALDTICAMLRELLHVDPVDDITALAELAYRLTSGNPFLVVELIRSLLAEQLLTINQDGKWLWNEAEILGNQHLENAQIADAIIHGLIKHDMDPIREVLQVASCLGTEFSIRHLEVGASVQPNAISRAIQVLVFRRILFKTTEARHFRWAHDRYQQSAFKLIPEEERAEFKCRIGLELLAYFSREELAEQSFLVAGLLYGGERYFQTEEERGRIAELFCNAGIKASKSSAFEDASSHFQMGIDLLPGDHWEQDSLYELSLQLYNSLAEMQCCLGNTSQVDELCETIMKHSRNLQDQLRAYDTKVYSLSCRNDMHESVEVALELLRKLGQPVPSKVVVFLNAKELITTRRLLSRFTLENVLSLQPLRDWKKIAILQIIHIVFPAVRRSRPEYALFLLAKTIKITLRHGLSPLSAVLFSMFGMVLCTPVGTIEDGLRCEEIGFRIFEKFQSSDLRSRMIGIRYGFLKPWTDSMTLCFPHLIVGASAGMMSGDFEMSFINSFVYCIDGLLCGMPLADHFEEMKAVKLQYQNLGQDTVMFYLDASIQLAKNLLGKANDIRVLSGEEFDEQDSMKKSIATNNFAGISFVLLPKLFLAVFTDNFELAVEVARLIQKANTDAYTTFDLQYIPFLVALSEIILARKAKSKRHLRAANRELKRLEKLTHLCSDICWSNKIILIKAERDALLGCHDEAIRKFLLSVKMAEKIGRIHEQALAYERLGLLYSELRNSTQDLDFFRKARDLYEEWGCAVKVSRMNNLLFGR
jgi:predicted ATPase